MPGFLVTRTSQYVSDEPPCARAELARYTPTQVRTVKDFDEFDRRFGDREGPWVSKGINHRVHPAGIARDMPDGAEGWFVEIPDLAALLEFSREHGPIVVGLDGGIPTVEIYDDYRE
jgi:hypothetical protein